MKGQKTHWDHSRWGVRCPPFHPKDASWCSGHLFVAWYLDDSQIFILVKKKSEKNLLNKIQSGGQLSDTYSYACALINREKNGCGINIWQSGVKFNISAMLTFVVRNNAKMFLISQEMAEPAWTRPLPDAHKLSNSGLGSLPRCVAGLEPLDVKYKSQK